MKKSMFFKIIIPCLVSFLWIACGQNQEVYEKQQSDESSATASSTTTTAQYEIADIKEFVRSKKFIKSADIKIETEDSKALGQQVEKLCRMLDGEILSSNFTTEIVNHQKQLLNRSEAVEYIQYLKRNNLVLVVPAIHLDSVIDFLNSNNGIIHSKNLIAEDVRWKILASYQKKNNQKDFSEKIEAYTNTNQTKDLALIAIEKQFANNNALADETIKMLKLQDEVDFSLIKIELFEQIKRSEQIVQRTDIQKIGFKSQASLIFYDGLNLAEEFILLLIRLWFFLLLGSVGFLSWKKLSRKLEK